MLPASESPGREAQLHKKPKPATSSAPSSPEHAFGKAGGYGTLVLLPSRHRAGLIAAAVVVQLLLLLLSARSIRPVPSLRPLLRIRPSAAAAHPPPTKAVAECPHGRVYVYDLPPAFNADLLAACDDLNPWTSRCSAFSNGGFGPHATDLAGVVPASLLPAWYDTDQFALEVIFHRRVLASPCRTEDPAEAAAFFVPFYAGLAVGRYLWSRDPSSSGSDRDRDRDCIALLDWLKTQPHWQKSRGSDHFIVLGRITWDFRRMRDGEWGGSFLHMPDMENVTRLPIERQPWDPKEVGIPYPTGFHPRAPAEVAAWQSFVLGRTRSTLFGFAGATRRAFKGDFRGLLLDECGLAKERCRAVDCSKGRCGNRMRETMELFLDSDFCLQPRGDSFTRRSTFDCMLAGAVPVFFWRRSGYVQYSWYLPNGAAEETEGEWSVFIDRREVRSGKVRVAEVLEGIGAERVRKMRERVVQLIPSLVYAASAAVLEEGMEDAVDVAVEGVLKRFREQGRWWERKKTFSIASTSQNLESNETSIKSLES